MTPIRVLIADDSDAYRAGMARAVRNHPDLELVAEFDAGSAALAGIQEHAPDVALLDVRMPGLDGLELTARIRALDPPLRIGVVLLSAYMDETIITRAESVGADAYLSKAASRKEICLEVSRVGSAVRADP